MMNASMHEELCAVRAHDRVALPVANTDAPLDNLEPLCDRCNVLRPAAKEFLRLSIRPTPLAGARQIHVQILLLPVYPPVYGVVREVEAVRDLLGRAAKLDEMLSDRSFERAVLLDNAFVFL